MRVNLKIIVTVLLSFSLARGERPGLESWNKPYTHPIVVKNSLEALDTEDPDTLPDFYDTLTQLVQHMEFLNAREQANLELEAIDEGIAASAKLVHPDSGEFIEILNAELTAHEALKVIEPQVALAENNNIPAEGILLDVPEIISIPKSNGYEADAELILRQDSKAIPLKRLKNKIKEWKNRNERRIRLTLLRFGVGVTLTGTAAIVVTPAAASKIENSTLASSLVMGAVGNIIFGYFQHELQNYAGRRFQYGNKYVNGILNFSNEWVWKRFFLYSTVFNATFLGLPILLEKDISLNPSTYLSDVTTASLASVFSFGLFDNAIGVAKRKLGEEEGSINEDVIKKFHGAVGLYVSTLFGLAIFADAVGLEITSGILFGSLVVQGGILAVTVRTPAIEKIKNLLHRFYLRAETVGARVNGLFIDSRQCSSLFPY